MRKQDTKVVVLHAHLGKKELEWRVRMPTNIAVAIEMYGEREVYHMFLNGLVSRIQGQMRREAKSRKNRNGE